MEPRLQSSVLAGALMRRAGQEGGFAAVIAKGDPTSGAILLVLAERGTRLRILERAMHGAGGYSWQDVGNRTVGNAQETEKFLSRRREFDPDLWIIELDVPSTEHFVAELNDQV